MTTKYGIISDIHETPQLVEPALNLLKRHGAEKFILNVDVGNSQDFVGYVLNCAGESGIETYVQPGSHEKLKDFEPVIKHFKDKYSNLINVFDNQKISCNGHELVFLPGSDFLCGGEYSLQNKEGFESGFYALNNGDIRLINMNDLTKLVTNPDKTVVVSHIPAKQNNAETGPDMGHFHQARVYHKDVNDMSKWTYTELSVMPGFISRDEIEDMNPGSVSFGLEDSDEHVLDKTLQLIKKQGVDKWQVFVERKDNRGNEDLRNIYDKLGIRKAVSGHFHESVHRACDGLGNRVEEEKPVDELFWNASYSDRGEYGILTVNDNLVSYRNLNLNDFVR